MKSVIRQFGDNFYVIPLDRLTDWDSWMDDWFDEDIPDFAQAVLLDGVVMVDWYFGLETVV